MGFDHANRLWIAAYNRADQFSVIEVEAVAPVSVLNGLALTRLILRILVALAIYFVLALSTGQAVWSWVLLPIPAAVLVVFVLGTSWVFMIAGVLVKDLREIVALFLNLLVYLSPVVASESMI